MSTFLISILGALGIILFITIIGLILTQLFIKRADKVQTQTNILSEQSQCVIVDIDDLPENEHEPGITVISNDVIENNPHRHQLKKTTISVIDQTQLNQNLSTPIENHINSSNTSVRNPQTDKITLEY